MDLLRQKLDKQAEEYFEDFSANISNVLLDATEKRDVIRNLYDLVADESVSGGYLSSAKEEELQATRWRRISIGFMIATAAWIAATFFFDFSYGAEGVFSWMKTIKAASLAGVLLSVAAYSARQSGLHRNNEIQTRRFALEVTAITPFIASLEPEQQSTLKTALVERLFGQTANTQADLGLRLI